MLIIPLIVFAFVYRQTKSPIKASILAVALYVLLSGGVTSESFSWDKQAEKYPMFSSPAATVEYNATPFVCGKEMGDNTLTNLYRRVHNLDAIQRTEIFQFNDALAGGSYGIPRERLVGEAYDREMMALNQKIRDNISARRRPYDELYDVPTTPLMGSFEDCHLGDCQWQADSEGHILGIPSGTIHAYY